MPILLWAKHKKLFTLYYVFVCVVNSIITCQRYQWEESVFVDCDSELVS